MALGSVGAMAVSLVANTRDFNQKMDQATGKVSKFQSGVNKMGAAVTKAAKAAAVAAAASVAAFGVSATKSFVEFDTGMREVFTLMPELSAAAKDAMMDDVKDLSEEIAILPKEVVPALYQAISAGVPKENVFSFLEIAGKASIAGVTELSVAVDGLTSVTNAYGEEVINAEEVADIMFTAVKRGKTTFEELSARMFQAVPIASKVGLSFKNVAGAAAQITLAGVPMRVAMTQIRSLLNEVAFEGKELNKVFTEAAGMSFQAYIEAGGDIAGIIEILQGVAADTGVSVAELTSNLEAQQAMLNLSGVALGNLKDILAEMGVATGAVDEGYAEMAAGIQHQLDALAVWWHNLKLDIGEDLTDQLGELLSWLQDHQTEIGDRIKSIFDGIITGLEWLFKNGKTVKAALVTIAAGLTAVWVAANPVAGAVAAVVASFSWFEATGGIATVYESLQKLARGFADLFVEEKEGIKVTRAVQDALVEATGRAADSILNNLMMSKNATASMVADLRAVQAEALASLQEGVRFDVVIEQFSAGVNGILSEYGVLDAGITGTYEALLRQSVEMWAEMSGVYLEGAQAVSGAVETIADDTSEATGSMASEMVADVNQMTGLWWEWSGELSAADQAWIDNLKATAAEAQTQWQELQEGIATEEAKLAESQEQFWENSKDMVASSLGETLNEIASYRRTRESEEDAHEERMAAIHKEYAGRSQQELNMALATEQREYEDSRTTIGEILKDAVVDLLRSLREQLLLKAASHLVDAIALALIPGYQGVALGHLAASGIYAAGGAGLAIAGFEEGGPVPGRKGQAQIAVVHGHEWVLTPEQREGMRIDYGVLGSAVENGVYDAMVDVLGRQPSRPIVLNVDGRQLARGLFNPFMEENDRRGGVIVTA